MKKKGYLNASLAALLAATLAACGGDSSSSYVENESGGNGAPTPIEPEPPLPGNPDALPLVTYPLPDQSEVPVTIQALLRYDDSVYEQTEILDRIGLIKDPRGVDEDVEVTITLADRGRTVVVTPTEKLEPFTRYVLHRDFAGDEAPEHDAHEYMGYYFNTGGDPEGDQDARSYEPSELSVEELKPRFPAWVSALEQERPVDWSILRVVHTQPVDPDTVRYGDSEGDNLRVGRRDNGEFVDADVFVDGRNIVVAPKEPLSSDARYQLTYSGETGTAVESVYELPFTPLNQAVLQHYMLAATEPGWEFTYEGAAYSLPDEVNGIFGSINQNSPWTDRWVNALAGNADAELVIDLADAPGDYFTDPAHKFRIRKESLAGATVESVARNLGEDAGTVEVTFPTDITGYMVLVDEGVLGRLYTYLNIALENEEPRFVATEMAAYATIDDGMGDVTIEAVGALDPALLGQERAPGNGMFTFQIRVPGLVSE